MTFALTNREHRAVLEDAGWSGGAFLLRMGVMPADAYAFADTNAYADANANAYANAYANANADANADADADAYADTNTDANADADADADAYADADANADAYSDTNADAYAYTIINASGGKHLRNGLYIWTQPSGSVVVLRIGWIRRVEGDEYEALHMVTPKRKDYTAMLSDAAIDGPPKGWTYTRPLPRSSPLNRFHILGPVSLDPKQWADVCPRPEGWDD